MTIDKAKDKYCNNESMKRARYFHGMLMTDQDFRDEQLYHIEKRKLLNRALHGWGVVCGLKVKPTDSASQCVIVEPGLALDCNGNEIWVCQEQTVDLSSKIQSLSRKTNQEDPCETYRESGEQESPTLYVVIRYHESKTDPKPVHAPGGSCEEKTCDFTRTGEGYCIEVWDQWPDNQPLSALDQFHDPCETSFQPCKDPYPCPDKCCPEEHYILLATINCGPRFDFFMSKWIKKTCNCCIDSGREPHKIKFRLQEKRTLGKVCISNNTTIKPKDSIRVYSSYKFEIEDGEIDFTLVCTPNWEEMKNIGLFFKDGIVPPPSKDTNLHKISFDYSIVAIEAVTGTVDLIESIKFTISTNKGHVYAISSGDVEFLKSPIEIGPGDLCTARTISRAMIRNMEHRKYVVTPPWLAWVYYRSGEDKPDGPPWSGELGQFCAPKKEDDSERVERETTYGARKFDKFKKEMQTKMEEMVKTEREKSAEMIKKVKVEYEKKVEEMKKKITEMDAVIRKEKEKKSPKK